MDTNEQINEDAQTGASTNDTAPAEQKAERTDAPENIMADGANTEQTATTGKTDAVSNVLAQADDKAEEAKNDGEDEPGYDDIEKQIDEDDTFDIGTTWDGQDVKFGPDDIRAMLPALKRFGVPAGQAKNAAQAAIAYEAAKLKHDNEVAVRHINGLAAESRQVFGQDFKRVVGFANKALGLMDKQLAESLRATPVLVNDHRFLRFLAEVGERMSVDDGTGARNAGSEDTGNYNPGSWVRTSNRTKQ